MQARRDHARAPRPPPPPRRHHHSQPSSPRDFPRAAAPARHPQEPSAAASAAAERAAAAELPRRRAPCAPPSLTSAARPWSRGCPHRHADVQKKSQSQSCRPGPLTHTSAVVKITCFGCDCSCRAPCLQVTPRCVLCVLCVCVYTRDCVCVAVCVCVLMCCGRRMWRPFGLQYVWVP